MNHFLAGVGRALLIRGDNLIGVANTLTDSTFDFSVTSEDVRAGAANMLWGRYFHDSTLNVTLTDAMFRLEYMAAVLGTNVQSGGLSVKEEQVAASSGILTASESPVATNGVTIGWYKLPTDENWTVGTFNGKNISVTGVADNTVYCLKYFYENEDARSIVINANYVPSELHLVIINDLFNGDIATEPSETSKVGKLITDIPRFQLDGSQNLSLTSTGVASTSLSGSALAVTNTDSCEGEAYYGTMTEEIFGSVWQERVTALAIPDAERTVAPNGTTAITVVAIIDGVPYYKSASNFTFALTQGARHGTISSDGIYTATGSSDGEWNLIEVSLTGYDNVAPAYAYISIEAED